MREDFLQGAFKVPSNFDVCCERIIVNVQYFAVNYFTLYLVGLAISLFVEDSTFSATCSAFCFLHMAFKARTIRSKMFAGRFDPMESISSTLNNFFEQLDPPAYRNNHHTHRTFVPIPAKKTTSSTNTRAFLNRPRF
jgi:hypothetical protein